MVNPQNCCAQRAISQNNWTDFSTAVQFSQGIPPYRGWGKPKSAFTVFILHMVMPLNFRLSVIGPRSEWSLPHRGAPQNSEHVLQRKQQSFVSSAYIVCSEHLTATANDHMNTNEPEVDYSSHLDEVDFTLLLHSCYVLELIQIHNCIFRMCWIVDVTDHFF